MMWGSPRRKLGREKVVSVEAKEAMYEGTAIPAIMYGSETWVLIASERKGLKTLERLSNRVRNVEIRCESNINIIERVDRNVLKYLGR